MTMRVDWEAQTPTFEDRQVREVYARFGLAVYCGQCVERQLGMVLATVYGDLSAIETKDDFDVALDKEFAKTMGQMTRDLAKAVKLPAAFEGRLRHAVRERNRLVHPFFWDRAATFVSADGREAMIAELQEAADFLCDFGDELKEIHQCWLDKFGISTERVRQAVARLEWEADEGR